MTDWDNQCISCEQEAAPGNELREFFMFFSPFDDEEQGTGCFYCNSCYEDGRADDGTFHCDGCSRTISDSRGHLTHSRWVNERMECLRCVCEVLKAEGIAGYPDMLQGLFVDGRLFGMFFNRGELEAEGWIGAPGFTDTLVGGRGLTTPKALGYQAQSLHEGGRMIIIGYENLSIMGDEGYVTLYSKEPDEGVHPDDAILMTDQYGQQEGS